jgi:hypothetical protein
MRTFISTLIAVLTLSAPAGVVAAEMGKGRISEHEQKDIADHRAMAEAHLNAAKCLESGRPEKECNAQLAKDCKGLGIGKYCGMKHRD